MYAVTDVVATFRQRLQDLYLLARQPTYRTLETHADQDGRALRTSTVSDLLNGTAAPRWHTVETFVRACTRYATAHRVHLPPALVDLDRWHHEYQAMHSALSERQTVPQQAGGRASGRRKKPAVPSQLPAGTPFTGRAQHLAVLEKLLADSTAGRPAIVVISAISGTAGVGKTTLAVHWAHQIAHRFPDGQLYVNLRGFDQGGQVMEPTAAVRGFLDALGVPPKDIPADLEAQAALYRSHLSGRRMLLVLDNARDTAQVRPLLPGAAGCLVVVTSRNQLTGLVATQGAQPIALDVLTEVEARDLLADRLGAERIAAEPDAAGEIITRCARLPLALALVAANAVTQPRTSLRTLADQLADGPLRWRALASDEAATDLRTVFSWSYQALTPPAARLFRLLGLHFGPDVTAAAAASLAGVTLPEVDPLLAELVRANLLAEYLPGRYTVHDLLRAYATHLTQTGDPEGERQAAVHRLLDHCLHTAFTADRILNPSRDELPLSPPQPGVIVVEPADHQQAYDWFDREHAVLLAAADHAAAHGFAAHTWQLAWCLSTFLDRAGHWDAHLHVGLAAVAAATRLADPTAQPYAHRTLAFAYGRCDRYEDAYVQISLARDLYERAGDPIGQARAHLNLGFLSDRQGDTAQARRHADDALSLFRTAGHRIGQAHALNNIGWCHVRLGEYQQALDASQRALALHEDLGNRIGQANTWDTIALAQHHLGNHAEALACYETALTLFRGLGDRYYEADVLTRIGDTYRAAGDAAAARDAYERALAAFTELEHPEAVGVRAKLDALQERRQRRPVRYS